MSDMSMKEIYASTLKKVNEAIERKVLPSVEDFKFLVDNSSIANDITSFGEGIAYNGLDLYKIVELLFSRGAAKGKSSDMIVNDIQKMIIYRYVRGVRVDMLKESTFTTKAAFDLVSGIITTYEIKSRAGRDPQSLTLPRISLCFPSLSYRVFKQLEKSNQVKFPVSAMEVGISNSLIFAMDFVPSAVGDCNTKDAGTILLIHNMYQSHLTSKVSGGVRSKTKITPQQSFADAVKFCQINRTQSLCKNTDASIIFEDLKEILTSLDKAEIVRAINGFFNNKEMRFEAISPVHEMVLKNIIDGAPAVQNLRKPSVKEVQEDLEHFLSA